jgi:uncharacterized membrane protein
MRDFRVTVDINAPAAQVWSVVRDVERWAEWTASIRSIERLDRGPFTVGSRARVRQPRALPAIWEVTSLDEGRAFTWVTRTAGANAAASHTVDPWENGSRVTLAVCYGGPLGAMVGWLLRGLTQRYLGLEAAGLKRCEGG